MSKKIIIFVVLIVVAIVLFILLKPGKPAGDLASVSVVQNIEVNQNENLLPASEEINQIMNNLELVIIGYGPGKSHDGTFKKFKVEDVKVSKETGIIQNAKVVIEAESRDFKIPALNSHLCAEEFFDCDEYSEILFELKEVKQENENLFSAVGSLTFKGTTENVSFPINKLGGKYEVDVRLNVAQFGFKSPVVSEEVQIKINTK